MPLVSWRRRHSPSHGLAVSVVGLDVRLDILEYLREELGERFRPPQALKRKVRAGKLGKKTGEGFYVWEDGEIVGSSGDSRTARRTPSDGGSE